MDAHEYFKGKKITVMGLGLLGGIGDIRYLAEQGADLIVTDIQSPEKLAPSLAALKEFSNIKYTLGLHEIEDFRARDLIIKAPSTPLDSIYIAEARTEGIPITMWAALFARFARERGATIIGVTGTRGKTTTTALITAILERAGKQVITGGNVVGTAMLPHLPKLSKDSYVVLELDSWKTQGFAEERISPDIGVFTTFYPDHLNYYRNDLKQYLADKANIFLCQKEDDILVLGSQAAGPVREEYQDEIVSEIRLAGADDVPADWQLKIPGEHNRYNAACALAVARALHIPDEVSREALEAFSGVPGRLELIRDTNEVRFYNDTTATTPEATLAALAALDPQKSKNIILIMGGADKNIDMNKLLLQIPVHAKRVIMLAGTGTSRVLAFLPDASVFDNLKSAVDEAFAAAEPGDTILFSPAFASFGMFKNEYDRGDQFNALVKAHA